MKTDANVANILASHTACRCLLETFAKVFAKDHKKKHYKNTCGKIFDVDASTIDIIEHFEECPTCSGLILGEDETSQNLVFCVKGIKLPTHGSFLNLFQSMSQQLYDYTSPSLLRTTMGVIVVPENLDIVEKRLLVRFFMSQELTVVIASLHGLRDPLPQEITIPEKVKLHKHMKRKYVE